MVVGGCGLFTPRTDFEDPVTDYPTVDYFNFGALLAGSSEKFSKLDWYELFDDNFKYVNVRLANIEYDKTALINHLYQQREIYPNVNVQWDNTSNFSRSINTINLSNVGYTVQDSTAQFTGTSSFVIIRDANNIWRIAIWTDEPDAVPFFSPAE
jgi:hypothetical protein